MSVFSEGKKMTVFIWSCRNHLGAASESQFLLRILLIHKKYFDEEKEDERI